MWMIWLIPNIDIKLLIIFLVKEKVRGMFKTCLRMNLLISLLSVAEFKSFEDIGVIGKKRRKFWLYVWNDSGSS